MMQQLLEVTTAREKMHGSQVSPSGKGVSDVDDCQAQCNEEESCDAYTFDGAQFCWLYTNADGLLDNVWPADGKISGFNGNASNWCEASE